MIIAAFVFGLMMGAFGVVLIMCDDPEHPIK
jgi:hypothetical protein